MPLCYWHCCSCCFYLILFLFFHNFLNSKPHILLSIFFTPFCRLLSLSYLCFIFYFSFSSPLSYFLLLLFLLPLASQFHFFPLIISYFSLPSYNILFLFPLWLIFAHLTMILLLLLRNISAGVDFVFCVILFFLSAPVKQHKIHGMSWDSQVPARGKNPPTNETKNESTPNTTGEPT